MASQTASSTALSPTPEMLCPMVGSSIKHKGRSFYILASLYKGPFSDVFVITDGKQHYAMKTEQTKGLQRAVLKLDVMVLRQLNAAKNVVGFPKLIESGRTSFYKYIIMELVGPDLARLRRAQPNKIFSISTAIRVATQALERIEALHDNGWLCRDVKANNFAIGRGTGRNVIFMLDFGFARKYIDAQGQLLPSRNAAGLMGTIHYASLAAHEFSEQCRRDDLESWLYMVIEMIKGTLPWMKLNPKTEHMLIAEWKKFARDSGRHILFAGIPEEFDKILQIIDDTGFTRRPDYRLMQSYLVKSIERLKIDRCAPFEWELDDHMLKKAAVMGDIGESYLASEKLKELEERTEEKEQLVFDTFA